MNLKIVMANELKIYNKIPSNIKIKPDHIFKKFIEKLLLSNSRVNGSCD